MEDSDKGVSGNDAVVTEYASYEDYLDAQISKKDLYYLEDEELARQLVELGYRGSGEVLKREEFEAKKRAIEISKLSRKEQKSVLSSAGKDLKGSVFLEALAEREEANRNGRMTSILFIRDKNSNGQEISGYVDFAHRLKTEDFDPYFSGKRKILPRHTDLSFYNWDTNFSSSSSSPNYQVIAENATGLLFKNKRDRKIVNVDPKASSPGDNTTRLIIPTSRYLQVVIYDHITRRKA
jgi:hypothetical protein